jgi:probable rRNA maturation factor
MVEIDIIVDEEVENILPVGLERLEIYIRDVLARNEVTSGELNVVFIGDEFMSELNRNYKSRSGTTDVLSFNLEDNEPSVRVSAEIYVSLERAREQASELNVPFEEETVRLVTHGLLHIAGRVHDTVEEYDSMTAETEKLVRTNFTAESGK